MLRYFFIGGAPKSGTTWMQRALDLHPEILCSGEGHFHEFIARPLARLVGEYNDKLAVVSKAVYEGRPSYQQITRGELVEITRSLVTLLMTRRSKPGAQLIGDKTPANAKVVNDLTALFPDLKFVFMLRDIRDVAASRLGHAARNGFPEAEDRGSELYREVVRAAACDWRGTVVHTQAYAAQRPGQITTVRYEDLVRDRPGELSRVFAFLEVATSPEQLQAVVEGSSFEAFSGGREAGVEDRGSFYRKGVPGDWTNWLNDEALEILEEEAGEQMRLCGYATPGAHAAA